MTKFTLWGWISSTTSSKFWCLPSLFIYSRMLMISNQLAGVGSVNMPIQITAGAKPYNKIILVFWKRKLMSSSLEANCLTYLKGDRPLDWRLLGIGIFWLCYLVVNSEVMNLWALRGSWVFGRGRVRCFMSSFKVNFRFDRLVQVKPSTYWLLVQKSTEIVGEGGNGNRNRCKAVFLRSLTTTVVCVVCSLKRRPWFGELFVSVLPGPTRYKYRVKKPDPQTTYHVL